MTGSKVVLLLILFMQFAMVKLCTIAWFGQETSEVENST